MNEAEFITVVAVAIFIMGAAIGLVAVVSVGIRHEERVFRERRQLAEDESLMLGRPVSYQGITYSAPGQVSHGARALTGLRIRRARGAGPLATPGYEQQR